MSMCDGSGECLGAVFGLSAALTWAVAVILFKKSSERMSPWAMNYLKSPVGLLCFVVTLLFVEGFPQLPGVAWGALLLSGFVGISISDSLFFGALHCLGASRAGIVDCLYSPFVVMFAYFLLGEVLQPWDAVGAALIVIGVLLTGKPETRLDRLVLWRGVALGALAMATMAVSVVAIKPFLEAHSVLATTTVRSAGGTLGLLLLLPLRPLRRAARDAFRPQSAWWSAIPASILGTYIALYLWVAGYKYADAGMVSLLNQTTTLFIVIFATVFLKEALTRRRAFAVALATAGSVLVLLDFDAPKTDTEPVVQSAEVATQPPG